MHSMGVELLEPRTVSQIQCRAESQESSGKKIMGEKKIDAVRKEQSLCCPFSLSFPREKERGTREKHPHAVLLQPAYVPIMGPPLKY